MLELAQLHQHIKTLHSGDESTRRQVLHTLRNHEPQEWEKVPEEVVHSLVEALKSQLLNGMKRPFLRQEVAIILGKIGAPSEPAIPQLIELVQEGVPDGIREAAAAALGKIGKKAKAAVDPLVHLLASGRSTLAIQAVRALCEIGCADHRVRNALTQLWLAPNQSQSSQVHVAIAFCKLKLEAVNLLKFLTHTLVASQDAGLRKLAAEALALCNKNKTDVVPALVTVALTDKNDDVRLVAQKSLDELGLSQEKAIQLCARQLHDSTYAEAALRKSGPQAVPALVLALKTEEEATTREKAARILGSLGEVALEAVPALTKTLTDKVVDIRLASAKALWNITKKADDIVPVLIDLLDEKKTAPLESSEERRRFLQTVIEALWRIGPAAKAAIPALNKKAKDDNRLIKESALSALKDIAPPAPTKVGHA
jgi:HEAT repeat protein